MRRVTCAMAMALIGALACQAMAQQDRRERDNRAEMQPAQLPDGFQLKNLNQLDNIRGELTKVVQATLTRDDFHKLVDQFAVYDRNQMKDYKNQDFNTVDGLIAQINQDWRQKYGHEFNIKRANNVFTDQDVVVQGIVTNPNVAAANFPVPAAPEAQLAGEQQRARQREGQADQVLAKDLQESKGAAIVRLPGGDRLPPVEASLIEEGHGSWYVALPPNTSSHAVHQQLQNELTYLGQSMNQWPTDETMAYRLVAHRIMMALYDVNPPESGRNVERK